MSKIIHAPDDSSTHWHVYLTPIGGDPEKGDDDEFIDSFGELADASLAMLELMAKQDRERIENNREEIADYERHIERQKAELLVSDCEWEKTEAKCRALFRRQLAIAHGEVSEQLQEMGISFEALAQFHSDKERAQ